MNTISSPPSVQTFVVATMPGSLPMGGFISDTPIHALTPNTGEWLLTKPTDLTPTRTDIDLGGQLAFVIDPVVTADEADRMVGLTERMGYRQDAPGIQTAPGMRMNKSVHWLGDEGLLGELFRRIGSLLPQELDGDPLYPHFSHRINMYKYDANDVFNKHTDGDWPGFGLSPDGQRMEKWPGLRSKLTMLLYLNGPEDGVEGGSTRLYKRGGGFVDVIPRKGAALFFRHGFGTASVLHEGTRVQGSVAKYVARINVMYS